MTPLLLECVRAHPNPIELRRLSGLCPDWDGLIKSASKLKVDALVFRALNKACPEAVPPDALSALQNRFWQNTTRNLFFAKELLRLLDSFGLAGIQTIPLKGPALAWSVYETPGLRSMSDLDLLVPRRDVRRAIDLLTSDGYRRAEAAGLQFFSDSGEALLKRADGGCDVDLHWRIVPAHFNPLDAAEIRARLTSIDVAGRQIPAFCPEDLLAYLCLNGAKNDWNSLAGLCDLDRLIDSCRLDWDAIFSRAARRRMSQIVSLGLCIAQDMLGSSLPPEVSSRVHADARAAALAASMRAHLQEGRTWSLRDRLLLRFRLMEGAWRKFLFFWYILRPTPAEWRRFASQHSYSPFTISSDRCVWPGSGV